MNGLRHGCLPNGRSDPDNVRRLSVQHDWSRLMTLFRLTAGVSLDLDTSLGGPCKPWSGLNGRWSAVVVPNENADADADALRPDG